MKEIKALISVKKIIALLLSIVFCYLSIKKIIGATEFLSVFTLVVGYYFGQSTVKESKEK